MCGIIAAQNNSPEGITICWDISGSMDQRDIDKEFEMLEKIIQRNPNAKVQLLKFNWHADESEYTLEQGDWSALRKELQEVYYDGGTRYRILEEKIKFPMVYLFTDGNYNGLPEPLKLPKGSMIINTSPKADTEFLNYLALLNKARLMDFAVDYSSLAGEIKKTTSRKLTGTLFVDNSIAPNTEIRFRNLDKVVQTDAQGVFSLEVKSDQIKETVEIRDKTFEIDLDAQGEYNLFVDYDKKVIALDEVVVKDSRKEEKVEVLTGMGLENKNAIGYAITTIDESEITPIETKPHDALYTKVPGLQMGQENGFYGLGSPLSTATLRGRNSIFMSPYALIVVDGVALKQPSVIYRPSMGKQSPNQTNLSSGAGSANYSDNTDVNLNFIDPANIKSITVLKGLAATNRYGSLGSNGVILITTKTGNYVHRDGGKDPVPLNQNIYEERIIESAEDQNSTYLDLFSNTANSKAALELYRKMKPQYHGDIHFYYSVAEYFRKSDSNLAENILTNLLEKDELIYSNLRALYLIADYQNNNDLLDLVSQLLVANFDKHIQSYLDRARVLKKMGNTQEAAEMLAGILSGESNPDLDFSPLHEVAGSELREMVANSSGLNLASIDPAYRKIKRLKARLVFEWDESKADFTLTFVNPQKRFIEWEHSDSDKNQIKQEVKHGYSIVPFEIEGDKTNGTWLVTIKKNESGINLPTYVKCKVQRNFGSPLQYEEEHLLRLNAEAGEYQFFQLQIN